MAIDAKQSFLGQVERGCADRLTVTDLSGLMGIISDVLQGFRMEELRIIDGTSENDDLLDAFIASMKIQGRSPKTIARYTYEIGRFMKFAKVQTRQVNVYHIRNWITANKNRGLQDSTLESHRQVVSAYFGWLFREGLIEKNPMANVGVIKVPKKQKKIYSDIDMEKLNANAKTLRDRTIINFLRSTGCRISEMTSLNKDSVDLNTLECVVHGKGNKDRVVYLDEVTGMLLEKYLKKRKDTEDPLFIGKRKERLEPGGVRTMLKTLGKKCGVDHVHPHKFRRTLATELSRHGMQIQEVASILGHESLNTTMKYVVLNREDVKHDYRRYA